MLRNSVFSLRNDQVWVLPSCRGVDFLLHMNRCETFIYVQYRSKKGSICWFSGMAFFQTAKRKIRAVPFCKGVGLLMLRNRIFRLRNVQKWAVPSCKGSNCWSSGIAFSDCETVRYGLFRPAKGVDLLMVRKSVFMLRIVQIWAVPNCNYVYFLCVRNDDFRLRNVQLWALAFCNSVDLLILRDHVCRLRNVKKLAVTFCKEFDLLMFRNRVFMLRNG